MEILKTVKTIGKNDIKLIYIQGEKNSKNILIIGVFHGEEPQGEYLINKYLEDFSNNNKNNLYFIPCLNPDGKSVNKRQNSNGIDLNRNFPTKNWRRIEKVEYFGGTMAGSEIETKFMIEVLNDYKFDAILSIHAPFKIVNYDGPAQDFAKKISELTGYKVQADIGYPTPGSFGNYAGVERNIPTITLELDENDNLEYLWEINKKVFDFLANV